MDKEKVKEIEEYLNDYNFIKGQIGDLKLQLEELKDDYIGVNSKSIGEGSCKTNKISSSVENEIIDRENEINILEKKIKKKQLLLNRLDNAINNLDSRDRLFIDLKYIKKERNYTIADTLNCSVEYVTEKRKLVIRNLIKIIGEI